jgi:beta-fructofuranosidase
MQAAGSPWEFFFRPEGAFAADFIPFFAKGRFYLYYLHDWRDAKNHGEGTPWYLVSTEDFVHFSEHGEMVARGSAQEQDLYVFTGSVVEGLGRYHIFYTGHNPHLRKAGKPEEAVMHAVSNDLLHWAKQPGEMFFSPGDNFEPHDWRDPFVFWNPEVKEYWMLTAARLKTGPSRRRGCTALSTSEDLVHWTVRNPFWSPGLYFTHECPDLFKMGDWWYLVFSEFSERMLTRYRMSRSLKGPWLTPANDTFDGRAYYAAKTASDGQRRYLFGWLSTRDQNKDYRNWNWGGNLVVHELWQAADGTLCVRVPHTVDAAFGKPATGRTLKLSAPGTFRAEAFGKMTGRMKLEVNVSYEAGTQSCGVMLRASNDLEKAYYIRIEPRHNRMVFDSWPRPGDQPFMLGLERPLRLAPGRPVNLKIFVDGTVCVVYACGAVAMSTRLYNLPEGNWSVFAQEGTATFRTPA